MGFQIARRSIAGIVVGEDDDRLAGSCPVAIGVGAHCGTKHHAGNVIAAKGDGPLFGARREHRTLCDDAPVTLTRLERRRLQHVIVYPLSRAENVAVVPTEYCRTHA